MHYRMLCRTLSDLVVLLGSLSLCAALPSVATATTSQAEDPSPPPPKGALAEDPWRRDELGREYRVEAIERSAGYRVEEGNRLLTRWGIYLDLEGEDDEYYYFRLYRAPEGAPGTARASRRPSPEPPVDTLGIGFSSLGTFDALTFEPMSRGLPPQAQWRNGFRLADLDGDGRLDLVLPPARKRIGGPLLLLQDDGGWKRWSAASLPAVPWDYGDVEVADFDGDGHPDLAFAMHLRGLLVLVQREPGQFEPWSKGLELGRRPDGGPPFSSRALRSEDLDGDGRPDLLVLGEGPQMVAGRPGFGAFGLRVFRNLGDGRWEDRGALPGSEGLFGQSLAYTPAREGSPPAYLASSDSAGTSGLLMRIEAGRALTVGLPLPSGFQVVAAAIGPLGSSASPALVIATTGSTGGRWVSTLEALEDDGSGGWQRETVARVEGAYQLTALALADLDGGGTSEVLVGTGEGELLVLRRQGGAWERANVALLPPQPGCRVYHVEAARDGDGSWLVALNRAGEAAGSSPFGQVIPGCSGGGDVHVWRVSPWHPHPEPAS